LSRTRLRAGRRAGLAYKDVEHAEHPVASDSEGYDPRNRPDRPRQSLQANAEPAWKWTESVLHTFTGGGNWVFSVLHVFIGQARSATSTQSGSRQG